jgi:Cu+-exporting ATPase
LSAAHLLPLAGDLGMLPPVVAVAERTQRTIWRNYAWAFGYNAVFLPMAALGVLHPIFAAGLMFASSVTVLVNSLRLRPALDRVWKTSAR